MNGRMTCIVPAAVLMLAIMLSGCSSAGYSRDPWLGRDKALHFMLSGIIGGGTAALSLDNGNAPQDSAALGAGISLTFGTGKEWYDRSVKGTSWSWKDLAWDIAGTAAGTWCVIEARD